MENKVTFKMFKAGKLWIVAGIATLTMLSTSQVKANADAVTEQATQTQTDEDSSLTQMRDSQAQAEEVTQSENAQTLSTASESLAQIQKDLPAKQAEALHQFDQQTSQTVTKGESTNTSLTNSFSDSQTKVYQTASETATQTAKTFSESLANEPAHTDDAQVQAAKSTLDQSNQSAQETHDTTIKAAQQTYDNATAGAQQTFNGATAGAEAARTQRNNAATTTHDKTANDLHNQYDGQIKAAQLRKDAADAAVNTAKKGTTTPTATPIDGNTTTSLNAYPESARIHSLGNLPTTLTDVFGGDRARESNADALLYDGINDNSEHFTGQPSQAQIDEAAALAVMWINSERTRQGKAPLTVTVQSQQAAADILKQRQAAHMGWAHTATNQALLDKVSSENPDVEYLGENMGMIHKTSQAYLLDANGATYTRNYYTTTQLATGIYNTISMMYYQDESSQDGHRKNFLNGNATTVGLTVQLDQSGDDINDGLIILFDLYKPAAGKTLTPIAKDGAQLIAAAKNGEDPTPAQLQEQTQAAQNLTRLTDELQAKLAANDTDLQSKLAASNAQAKTDETSAQKTYDEVTAAAKASLEKAINAADLTLATAKANNQVAYEKAISSLHGETSADRDARIHTAYENKVADLNKELTNLKTQQAQALADYKAQLAKALANYQAQRVQDRQKLVAQQAEEVKNYPAYEQQTLADLKTKLQADYDALVARHHAEYTDAKAKLSNINNTGDTEVIYDPATGTTQRIRKEVQPALTDVDTTNSATETRVNKYYGKTKRTSATPATGRKIESRTNGIGLLSILAGIMSLGVLAKRKNELND